MQSIIIAFYDKTRYCWKENKVKLSSVNLLWDGLPNKNSSLDILWNSGICFDNGFAKGKKLHCFSVFLKWYTSTPNLRFIALLERGRNLFGFVVFSCFSMIMFSLLELRNFVCCVSADYLNKFKISECVVTILSVKNSLNLGDYY